MRDTLDSNCKLTSDRWGQIYILDSLLNYVPQTSDEATVMTERIVARLQHSNSAVVLTVIKVLLYLMNYIDSKQSNDYLCKKMGPPLGECLLGSCLLWILTCLQ